MFSNYSYVECKALKGKKVNIIADGGIRFSGDISSNCCRCGFSNAWKLVAGTEEAPGELELFHGEASKLIVAWVH